MQTFSSDISDALQLQGRCFLPGIGLLHIVRSPAERSYQENQLNPPSYEIVLDPSYRGGKGEYSIAGRIAAVHNLPPEEASRKWEEVARLMREKLAAGASVELEGLGLLSLGEEGTISFVGTHVPTPVYKPLSLDALKGLTRKPPLSAVPAASAAMTEIPEAAAADPAPWNQPETPADMAAPGRQPRPRWWIIGSLIILIVVGWFTYRGTMQRKKQASHIAKILDKENTQPARTLSTRDSLALLPDTAGALASRGSDSIRYFIVIAEYTNENKALHQYKKMRNWGHAVELRTNDSVTFKLAYAVTSVPADTTVNLVKMMKIYGEKTHIEYELGK